MPDAPVLISTSSTQIVLQLFPSADNMGAIVTNYKLFRNGGAGDT
jgi:hypothetical protein